MSRYELLPVKDFQLHLLLVASSNLISIDSLTDTHLYTCARVRVIVKFLTMLLYYPVNARSISSKGVEARVYHRGAFLAPFKRDFSLEEFVNIVIRRVIQGVC